MCNTPVEVQFTSAGGYRGILRTFRPRHARSQTTWLTYEAARSLVEVGDTARGVPACNSCHGERAGGPIETPTLTGQRREYLERQLQACASGERKNDLYRRMRSIAAKLRPDEIPALAAYYASAHPPRRQSAR